MKVYNLKTVEDYKNFLDELAGRDQPVYVYQSSTSSHLVIYDVKQIENPDEEIDRLLEAEDDEVDDDEPLFDYNDDDDGLPL